MGNIGTTSESNPVTTHGIFNTITNNKGKNAVLIGEEDWRAIEETWFLMSIPNMAESIIKGGNTPLEECLSEDEVEW